MKSFQKGSVALWVAVVLLMVVVIGGYLYLLNKQLPMPQTSLTTRYTFKSFAKDTGNQTPDYSVEIYKDNKLVHAVSLVGWNNRDDNNYYAFTMDKPILFTVSPDQKYVAFKGGIWGGSCVGFEKPMVIDLTDYSIVRLDQTKLEKIAGGISEQKLNSIKWISNETVQASMVFGDKDVGGCSNGKVLFADVNFVLIK